MKLCRQLRQHRWFQQARSLAAYLANDGEIDPTPLIRLAWRLGKRVYLPVLHPLRPGFLHFIQYDRQTPLTKNRFGIPEPRLRGYGTRRGRQCRTQALGLVLLPLVGFDEQGQRLGMGGGFYDRSFAPRPAGFRQPRLMGLAHECQKVDALPVAGWDVPLSGVMTPESLYQDRKTPCR